MEGFSAKLRWLKVHGLALLVLLAIVGGYFLLLIPRQETALTQRSFRLLADRADQIEEGGISPGRS
jgi:hypothetical protein